MALAWSRYVAVVFAIALGIGEAVINWGRWQYAPLWIVDYVIVAWLLWAFVSTRGGHRIHLLLAAWAFTAGVFYMALFINLDPQLGLTARLAAGQTTHVAPRSEGSLESFLAGLATAGSTAKSAPPIASRPGSHVTGGPARIRSRAPGRACARGSRPSPTAWARISSHASRLNSPASFPMASCGPFSAGSGNGARPPRDNSCSHRRQRTPRRHGRRWATHGAQPVSPGETRISAVRVRLRAPLASIFASVHEVVCGGYSSLPHRRSWFLRPPVRSPSLRSRSPASRSPSWPRSRWGARRHPESSRWCTREGRRAPGPRSPLSGPTGVRNELALQALS